MRINGSGTVNAVRGRAYRKNSAAAKSESVIRFVEKLVNRHRGKMPHATAKSVCNFTVIENPLKYCVHYIRGRPLMPLPHNRGS